jgi:hypothetical protein
LQFLIQDFSLKLGEARKETFSGGQVKVSDRNPPSVDMSIKQRISHITMAYLPPV